MKLSIQHASGQILNLKTRVRFPVALPTFFQSRPKTSKKVHNLNKLNTPKLNFLVVADAPIYIALPSDTALSSKKELRFEDICGHDWILPAPHVNPYFHEVIMGLQKEKRIGVREIHHFMTAEEAYELILAHKGVAFMTCGCAWKIARDGVTMRPLTEESLRLVTKLATRADNKSRLVSEFVRAAGRKLISARFGSSTTRAYGLP